MCRPLPWCPEKLLAGELLARAYAPSPAPPFQRECVAFIHGGGFVLGSVRGYHEYASRISVATKSTVALIDYRR
ncbi:alpha/beta hydrolase fold domain-containing protein, partial [Nocardia cyriacigeorgica]|nr:alpha/beta hydrolase fold domain-containing protein [Nocardia cyriacigeorgica]